MLSFILSGIFSAPLIAQQHQFINRFTLDPSNPAYVKKVVLVKFKDSVNVSTTYKSGAFKTGVDSLNLLLKSLKATGMSKVFQGSRKLKAARVYRDRQGNLKKAPQLFNIYKISYKSDLDAKTVAKELSKQKEVEYAEPDYLFYTDDLINRQTPADKTSQKTSVSMKSTNSSPDDPFFQDGSQSYLNTVDVPKAWAITTGDSTQIIGIIDTGVDGDHSDLKDNMWTNPNEIPGNGVDDDHNGYVDDVHGWDFVNNDNDPADDNSHGTHVAGIADAEGNNGIGITGVAWHAKIMPIKVMQSSGIGSASDIAAGVNYAAQNGATVINMSIGSYGESQTLKIALENAYAGTGDGKGVILVAAAGNDHLRVDDALPGSCGKYSYGVLPAPMYPAAYPFVVGVMASDAGPCDGFSNWDFSGPVSSTNGLNYEIEAPGVNILSTKPDGNYWQKSGTSMASPIVAGAVALMRSNNPSLSGEQIFARLIQGANNGVLDIYKSLSMTLQPDLQYQGYAIEDTLPGDNKNGVADAGETLQLFLKLKNAGGQDDSVWSKLSFAPFEDTTVVQIIDSTSYIGSIGTYAEMTGKLDPMVIKVNPNIANNRDIQFLLTYGDKNSSKTQIISLKVENGVLYQGLVSGKTILTPNKYYIITGNTVFDSLIIKPGTIIRLKDDASILINQYIKADGKPDSLITFTHNDYGMWGTIKNASSSTANFFYCIFEYGGDRNLNQPLFSKFDTVSNCIFRLNHTTTLFDELNTLHFTKNIITENLAFWLIRFYNSTVIDNTITNNQSEYEYPVIMTYYQYLSDRNKLQNNILINNYTGQYSGNKPFSIGSIGSGWGMYKAPPNYYGTTDSTRIENMIEDFFENGADPVLSGYDSAQTQPSPLCHGIPWDVRVNGISVNKYDHRYNAPNGLGVVGGQKLHFTVYFNRAMNTAYTPLLTFGVRDPYTQHVVSDSTSWSADSTVWTAYGNIGQNTGDGIQQIRVANAKDNEDFEIPIEDTRFQFVVQAASASSVDFTATPGIGKVKLEWPATNTSDVQGYNMYRYYNLTDSTYSDTLLVNPALITDTVFTDFNVIPDTTYHYLYRTVSTGLTQTDFSKSIMARPFSAPNGDANGDMSVNVLDLTTIVSYILGKNPQPFLFDAADINGDGNINVLDVISIVKTILGQKSTQASTAWLYDNPPVISMKKDIISLNSNQQLAALQFELEGTNLATVRLSSQLKGFELSYAIVNGKLLGILYSYTGKLIPGGIQNIIQVQNATQGLKWGKVFGSDIGGKLVQVKVEGAIGADGNPVTENDIQVSPNPFSTYTTLNYQIEKDALVQIEIYNLSGQLVTTLQDGVQTSGNYEMVWNGKSQNKQGLSPGIYLCKMVISPVDGSAMFSKEVKILRMR